MKRNLIACSFLPLLLSLGCGDADMRTYYRTRGVYVGPAFNGEAIVVDHENIPGYMPAMRMTLRLAEPQLIEGASPGDSIGFRLAVTLGDGVIDSLGVIRRTH